MQKIIQIKVMGKKINEVSSFGLETSKAKLNHLSSGILCITKNLATSTSNQNSGNGHQINLEENRPHSIHYQEPSKKLWT